MISGDQHPDHLLPWFTNATLSASEREAVELHVENCARCREELVLLSAMRRKIQSTDIQAPGDLGLHRLLRDVGRQSPAIRTRSWWRPALAAAVVVIVLQSVMLYRMQSGPIEPLGAPAMTGVILQVRFVPDATELRIRQALQALPATLVDGPGALGVYRLRLEVVDANDAERINQAVAHLRSHGDVVSFVAPE